MSNMFDHMHTLFATTLNSGQVKLYFLLYEACNLLQKQNEMKRRSIIRVYNQPYVVQQLNVDIEKIALRIGKKKEEIGNCYVIIINTMTRMVGIGFLCFAGTQKVEKEMFQKNKKSDVNIIISSFEKTNITTEKKTVLF